MAVADVYDALISKCCYKKAFRHLTDQFQRIASEFKDTGPRPMEQLWGLLGLTRFQPG